MKKKSLIWMSFLLIWWMCTLPVKADSMEGAIITRSPDGMAFTTNAGEKQTQSYRIDYEVSTGVEGTLRSPEEGEHLYDVIRRDSVPIKTWKVSWKQGVCQHHSYPEGNQYHGIWFNRAPCYKSYYSGWLAYCADCGELVSDRLFYMNDEVAKSIGYLDMSKSYYYKCPHCDNLEQAVALVSHTCKAVSPNMYYVRYHANFGTGYMEKSAHMVNNATEYEGRDITPQTTLNLNTYTRVGYEFTGWNTKKDGSGTAYEDGARIFNLSMEENASVVLYAQWKKRESVLEIDPNGGYYEGSTTVKRITGEYQSEITLGEGTLTPPKGHRVQFDAMGGAAPDSISGTMSFVGWECIQPFQGTLSQGIYCFMGKNGAVDHIKALYQPNAIILPEAVREGYSFGGWYADKDAQIPIGMSGDSYLPAKDITLYASWVDLKLTAEDNYTAHAGTGAVNLSWMQKDNRDKLYEVYQKSEDTEWQKLESFEVTNSNEQMSKTIYFTGTSAEYTVPFDGYYTLKLTGASGEDYANYKGGRGGEVTATVYLKKGEKLQYQLGGQNGYPDGGSGSLYGNGGGGSCVSTQRMGTLLVAGGGGGASLAADGGAGGRREHLTSSPDGENGECGGGGGVQGGVSGDIQFHEHAEECRHLHIGSPELSGGCYTIPVRCGSTDIKYEAKQTGFYYGNIADDGSHIYCVRCGSYECPGHILVKAEYTCQKCFQQSKYPVTQCSAITGYALSCERDESYVCGCEDDEILQIKVATGGSNYVNGEACIDWCEKSGVHNGDGELYITGKGIGFLREKEWKGVQASDMEAPNVIEKESIQITAVGEDEIRISWKCPKDNGTEYYHQVKSYDIYTMEPLCCSNITTNTLTSGIYGYRYIIDTLKDTEITECHSFLSDRSTKPFMIAKVNDKEEYLHIAPQDKAGNIGPTIHIPISKQELIYWPIRTERLELKDDVNVVQADEPDTYYVRADGNTPIQITLKGEMLGTAGENYQIDEATYQIALEQSREPGEWSLLVPKCWPLTAGSYTYQNEEVRKRQMGEMYLQDASFTWIQRYNSCRSLQVKQQFLVPESLDGEVLCITPGVAVQSEEKIYSDPNQDKENSIRLIGDGAGPNIEGTEQLNNLEYIDFRECESLELEFRATDYGSGLVRFYVEVKNPDNGASAVYEDTHLTGKIKLNIRKGESLFDGEFRIIVYAKDRVGNESTFINQSVGVSLDAYITRVLEPHTAIFKKGESGVLHVSAWGYVDKVEILFPQSFDIAERIIYYEIPGALKQEEIPFIVPLTASEGQMTIQVKAYKNGVCLEEDTGLVTIEVTGSVLNEFRTRLR
ncbi:MAG: InlB B-repeat-containing protein [Lachnospiraceae bacterium]|nr:InlB B-repeat-containing protein [Lachnospiraceae bacterium]